MKPPRHTPSATSLPRAPHDDDRMRVRNYAITMAVRTACFILMAVVTPYSWYTWLFAVGAIFLPYVAVVIANAGQDSRASAAQSPLLSLPTLATTDTATPEQSNVITVQEARTDDEPDAT